MRFPALVALILLIAGPLAAQQACPCVPLTKLWTVTSCDTWNCAASALILANGDPMTFTVSTGNPDHPWIVLKQIVSGTATDSPDEPYQLDSFDGIGAAAARFSAIESAARPQLVSAPDGKLLVLSLRSSAIAKKRSVGH